jgi:hypothetical protein
MHETTTDYWLNPDNGQWYSNKYSFYENNVETKFMGVVDEKKAKAQRPSPPS